MKIIFICFLHPIDSNVASDKTLSNGLTGLLDNILLSDLSDPIAQYLLNIW